MWQSSKDPKGHDFLEGPSYMLKFLFEPHEEFWKAPRQHPHLEMRKMSFGDLLQEWHYASADYEYVHSPYP